MGLKRSLKALLDLRGPLSRISPEEQMALPEAPEAGHLGVQDGLPPDLTNSAAFLPQIIGVRRQGT